MKKMIFAMVIATGLMTASLGNAQTVTHKPVKQKLQKVNKPGKPEAVTAGATTTKPKATTTTEKALKKAGEAKGKGKVKTTKTVKSTKEVKAR